MLWKRTILALTLSALTAISAIHAQAPAKESPFIGEIHATGSNRYGDAQISAVAGLKVGDPVTREQIQAAADRMSQTGLFTRVNYEFMSKGDKISLTFELTDAPLVPVFFDDFPWFTDDQLADAIRADVPIYDGNAPTGGTMLDDMSASISKLLMARGISGTVEHKLVAQPTRNAMMMQFRVEGPAVTVGSIDFSDSLAQGNEPLRDRKNDLVGKPYSRYSIEVFENEQVRPVYLAAGHVGVRFNPPKVSIPGGGSQTGLVQVPVLLEIDPGPVYTLGGITWNGVKLFDEKSLADLIAIKPGEMADGMRIAAGWKRVEDEYARRGYLDAKLTPEAKFDASKSTVSYEVNVSEGIQYHMGVMVITGLSLDAERRLRAAWQIPQGQFFDRLIYEDLLTKIEKPTVEIFGDIPVHYTQMGHWLRTDPNKHTVDVLLDFQ